MDIHFVELDDDEFPPPSILKTEDLAVIGSNLLPATIIKAYKKGYFPWFNTGEPPCWYHMDPRLVLIPEHLRISKSMQQVIRQHQFSFTVDKCFGEVMRQCRCIKRNTPTQGSWISDEIEESYMTLHEMGIAHSAEAWQDGELAGGLYGVQLGNVFFGESMFAKKSNASKFAFIQFVKKFADSGGQLIDCQQKTDHLCSLGATVTSRREFVRLLEKWIPQNDNVW